mmetsp:Transcript_102179/g.256137  ORF Transcript_102179/g.256137 Transcript_102179/m.256137 type:complete len:81 (+) Transcript_102179:1011-1253(+)
MGFAESGLNTNYSLAAAREHHARVASWRRVWRVPSTSKRWGATGRLAEDKLHVTIRHHAGVHHRSAAWSVSQNGEQQPTK